MSDSWSSALFGSKAGREASALKIAEQRREQEGEAVAALRERIRSNEGASIAANLVKGGEISSPAMLEEDGFLRRWLFAREWDVEVTMSLLKQHAGWRAHVFPKGYMPRESCLEQLADGKVFLQGVDAQGRAVVLATVRNHVPRKDLAPFKALVCYTLDAVVALCDGQRNPARKVVVLFDTTGAGMANVDLPAVKALFGMLNTHYVERLACFYIYNPPLLFWGLWNSLKGLLPEVTRDKIRMVDPADRAAMLEHTHPDLLPPSWGGTAPLRPVDDAITLFGLGPNGSPAPGGKAAAGDSDAQGLDVQLMAGDALVAVA